MNLLKNKNYQLFLVALFLLIIDVLLKGNDLSPNVQNTGADGLGEIVESVVVTVEKYSCG